MTRAKVPSGKISQKEPEQMAPPRHYPGKSDRPTRTPDPGNTTGAWASNPQSYFHGYAYIQQVDLLAHEMDLKWGLDRLRLLVDPELRGRFDNQRFKMDEAIRAGDSEQIMTEAQRSLNAYRALDRAATANEIGRAHV